MRLRKLSPVALALCVGALPFPALAAAPPAAAPPAAKAVPPGIPQTPPAKPKQPSLLTADSISYDETQGIVIATGRVEMIHQGRTIYTDKITYNQKTKVAVVEGNVRVIESSGDVISTDYAELTEDMAELFANQVRILMQDGSRLAAAEAGRRQGRFLKLNQPVYSPCDLCATDPERSPLWQFRAARAMHDQEEKEIRYQDAFLEMFGVPVFYTPYLSHPDPSVDRQSGFLAPLFGKSANKGSLLKNSYYYNISPDEDATFGLTAFSAGSPLMEAEWRKRFEHGKISLSTSATRADYTFIDDTGQTKTTERYRGHFFGNVSFDLNEHWRAGGNVAYASDFSYLKEYFYEPTKNNLITHGFVEGFYDRDYAGLHTYRFQSLNSNRAPRQPFVFPLAQYISFGAPGETLGGRWMLNTEIRGIARDGGADSTRFTIDPSWERRFVADMGLVATTTAGVRTDLYSFRDFEPVDHIGEGTRTGQATRALPYARVHLGYPLAASGESVEQLIEPVAAYMISAGTGASPLYPNEDSLEADLNFANLFSFNRFVGDDRREGGQRLAYGMRYAINSYDGPGAEFFLGQNYRISNENPYPYGSGLSDKFSDYVGQLVLHPVSWFDLGYRFRLDNDNLSRRSQNIGFAVGRPLLTFTTSYDMLDRTTDPAAPERVLGEYASFGLRSRVSRYWNVALSHSQGINPEPGPRQTALAMTYEDECFSFQALAERDHTRLESMGGGTRVLFRLVFRNIGEVSVPVLSSTTRENKNAP